MVVLTKRQVDDDVVSTEMACDIAISVGESGKRCSKCARIGGAGATLDSHRDVCRGSFPEPHRNGRGSALHRIPAPAIRVECWPERLRIRRLDAASGVSIIVCLNQTFEPVVFLFEPENELVLQSVPTTTLEVINFSQRKQQCMQQTTHPVSGPVEGCVHPALV